MLPYFYCKNFLPKTKVKIFVRLSKIHLSNGLEFPEPRDCFKYLTGIKKLLITPILSLAKSLPSGTSRVEFAQK